MKHSREKQSKEMKNEEKILDEEYIVIGKKVLAHRLHSNRERLRKENRWVGGRVPFGYEAYRGMLLIHEEEKEALQKILELYLEGHTVYQIWNILKKQGYKNKHGRDVDRNTVYRVMFPDRLDIFLGGRFATPIATPDEPLYNLLLKFV